MTSRRLAAALVSLTLLAGAGACGDDEVAVSAGDQPETTAPDPDTPVAGEPGDDPGLDDPGEFGDEFPTQQAIDDAHGVLGMYEDDLPDDVRIGRRGDEQFALTEDYVLGRRTVELDDTDGDGYRVVSVTVELPAGPETYELEPG